MNCAPISAKCLVKHLLHGVIITCVTVCLRLVTGGRELLLTDPIAPTTQYGLEQALNKCEVKG